MNIPSLINLPPNALHPRVQDFLTQVGTQLQLNLSNEGYTLPTLTSAQIAQLNPATSVNKIFINSTTNQLIVNLGGTFKVVQTS